MDERKRNLFRFRRQVIAEHLAEQVMHDGVQPLFDETIAVLLGLPNVDVAKANMRELAKNLKSAGGLRAGLSIAAAADTIWVTNSAEVYVLLTSERNWQPHRYERWLAETWCRLLLPDS